MKHVLIYYAPTKLFSKSSYAFFRFESGLVFLGEKSIKIIKSYSTAHEI